MIASEWRCISLTSKTEINKREKETSLYLAAYDLFTTKGINNTAISDIVKEAGVAKGTFYLYFRDKYDILNKRVIIAENEFTKYDYRKFFLPEFTENVPDSLLKYIDENSKASANR